MLLDVPKWFLATHVYRPPSDLEMLVIRRVPSSMTVCLRRQISKNILEAHYFLCFNEPNVGLMVCSLKETPTNAATAAPQMIPSRSKGHPLKQKAVGRRCNLSGIFTCILITPQHWEIASTRYQPFMESNNMAACIQKISLQNMSDWSHGKHKGHGNPTRFSCILICVLIPR